jgi:hypothetical protein
MCRIAAATTVHATLREHYCVSTTSFLHTYLLSYILTHTPKCSERTGKMAMFQAVHKHTQK